MLYGHLFNLFLNFRLRSSVMDIKAFLQCKKLRRSHRLEAKDKSDTQTEKMKLGSLGHFSVLPLELKFFILRYLTGNVANLAMQVV